MNLKNRFVAISVLAAVAIPAIALAKKYNKDESKDSSVEIKVKAGPGGVIPFTAKVSQKKGSIFVTQNGGSTIIKLDGKNLKTGMDGRDEHMRDMVFKKHQYVEVIVPTDKVEQGLKDGKIAAKIKFGGTEVDKTIQDFKYEGGVAKGNLTVTTHELGLGEVCKPVGVGFIKFDKAACVVPELKISAAIAIKKD